MNKLNNVVAFNHPELGQIWIPREEGQGEQNLTGLEIAALVAGTVALWEATWTTIDRVRAGRFEGKDVVLCTNARRVFSGKVVDVSGFFSPEIKIENANGEKRTILYSSVAVICERKKAQYAGAREEAKEMLLVGDLTKEEYSKIIEGIKTASGAAEDSEKSNLPEDLNDFLRKKTEEKSEEKAAPKKTTTRRTRSKKVA